MHSQRHQVCQRIFFFVFILQNTCATQKIYSFTLNFIFFLFLSKAYILIYFLVENFFNQKCQGGSIQLDVERNSLKSIISYLSNKKKLIKTRKKQKKKTFE